MKQLTREAVIDELIDIRLDLNVEDSLLYDVLKEGTVGYDNLTNEQLVSEYLADKKEDVEIINN